MDADQKLHETWSSTIRTEELCKGIVGRLDRGDARFANHDQRIQAMEQATHDRLIADQQREISLKKRSRIFILVASAISVPAASWLWDWVARHISSKP